MMTSFVFLILIGLNFVLFPCEGKIIPPSEKIKTVAPGKDVTIEWSFDDVIGPGHFRSWSFVSSDGKTTDNLARIIDDGDPDILAKTLPGVDIIKPATLVLKNVDLRHNGTYKFSLATDGPATVSDVMVFVAVKPTMTVCSTPITVDEEKNFTCLCKGKNGQPPANVTWYKEDVQIGDTGDEEQTLSLINVTNVASGTYKCVGQSYTLKAEKFISLTVRPNVPPKVTSFTSGKAVLGKSVTLKCNAEGRPSPTYTIVHNNTDNVVSNEKTHTIEKVKYSDAGWYECTAKNKLGNDSKVYNLTVLAKDPESKTDESSGGLSGGAVAGIVIGVLLLLVIVIFVVWWCKFKGNKNGDRRTAASGSGDRSAPVYADVRKDPKGNEPTYAVLDKNALNTGGDTTAKRDSGQPTQYADIEFGVRGDLV